MVLYIPRSIFHLVWLLYVRPETFGPTLVLLPTYDELDNKQIYSKVRSEVLGPVTRQNNTVLFLGDTMQIDIQVKTFLQNTGTDHQYYSVTEKSTAIFRTFFSRVCFNSSAYSVQMLAHIYHIYSRSLWF